MGLVTGVVIPRLLAKPFINVVFPEPNDPLIPIIMYFSLLRRQELAFKIDLIYTHMEENGVVFSSQGGSFQRKLLVNLSHYMNYHIRYPRRGENLKKDDKMRHLLEPLAKILCTEKK